MDLISKWIDMDFTYIRQITIGCLEILDGLIASYACIGSYRSCAYMGLLVCVGSCMESC